MNIKIYMVTHKKINYIPKDRVPIFVGNGQNTDNYLSDNSSDNISKMNPYFCELTAIYWIWKNDNNSEYVGIEHYRRFFCKNLSPITINKISKIIKKEEVIVTKEYFYKETIKEQYANDHISADLDLIREIIKNDYFDYLQSFDDVMSDNKISLYNMIVCRKKLFDSYCEWLFDILFKAEKKINYFERDNYQKRVFGFLAERLLNVWIKKNVKKTKKLHVYFLNDNKIKSIFSLITRKMKYYVKRLLR